MKRTSLVKLGIGLVAVAIGCLIWTRSVFEHESRVGMFSAALNGSNVANAEIAGTVAGMQAAMVPIVLTVLTGLAGIVFLIAAAIRKA